MTGNKKQEKQNSLGAVKKQRLANLKPFVKGDPRINRDGVDPIVKRFKAWGIEELERIIDVPKVGDMPSGKMPFGRFEIIRMLHSKNMKEKEMAFAYTLGKPKENIDLDGNVVFQWLKDKTKPEADE